jgi:hypothetical protein
MYRSKGEFMNRRLLILIVMIISIAITQGQTQTETVTPSGDQQAILQTALKELKMRRQALQSAQTAKLSLVNCGQLTLAQSQLETADVRMQLALTKIGSQMGLDAGAYEAVEDKDGNLAFQRKVAAVTSMVPASANGRPEASPSPTSRPN